MNRRDIYEAAAFYRSAALCGETVTGDEYAEAFATKPQPPVPDPASLERKAIRLLRREYEAAVRGKRRITKDAIRRVLWNAEVVDDEDGGLPVSSKSEPQKSPDAHRPDPDYPGYCWCGLPANHDPNANWEEAIWSLP